MDRLDKENVRQAFNLAERVQRNPYGMVAGAAGLGFILGGGLFTRLTANLLGLGLRAGVVAALPLVQGQLIRAGAEALWKSISNGGQRREAVQTEGRRQ
jgi:hypothetical protein